MVNVTFSHHNTLFVWHHQLEFYAYSEKVIRSDWTFSNCKNTRKPVMTAYPWSVQHSWEEQRGGGSSLKSLCEVLSECSLTMRGGPAAVPICHLTAGLRPAETKVRFLPMLVYSGQIDAVWLCRSHYCSHSPAG